MTDPSPTLCALRRALAALATPDGDYLVVCAACDERPVPVDRYRFPDRPTATAALELTTRYRGRLRRYDRRTRPHDLVVTAESTDPIPSDSDEHPVPNRNH